MIRVLADQVMSFSSGEKDARGTDISVKTKLGFCELPDWVAEHHYFKAGVAAKVLRIVGSGESSEDVIKAQEKKEELQAEIAELETKKEALKKSAKAPLQSNPPQQNETAEAPVSPVQSK